MLFKVSGELTRKVENGDPRRGRDENLLQSLAVQMLGRTAAPLPSIRREPMQKDFDMNSDKSYMRMDNVR